MRVSRTLVLGVLAAATVLLYGCSDKTIAEMSQKEMQEAVHNLPNAERQVFEQYMARNKFEHGMTRAVGSKQQVAALQPYDQVSVKEAIKIEKKRMAFNQ